MTSQIRYSNELNRELSKERASLGIKVAERTEELNLANEQVTGLVNTLSRVSEQIERGDFDPKMLQDLVDRPDSFGQLARVFVDLGYEVSAREKRLRTLRVVIPAGVALTVERDFDRLLETIVVEAQRLCTADGGSLYLRKNDTLEFLLARNSKLNISFGGTTGKESDLPPIPLYDENGQPNYKFAAVRVALTGERIVIDDVYDAAPDEIDFSMVKSFDQEHGYHSQSIMVIPLTSNTNEVVGVLQLINARDPSDALIPFHPDDALEALAMLGSAALSNYWREEKLRAEIDQLRIEVDLALQTKQVSEVVDTDSFKEIQAKAKDLRRSRKQS